MEYINYDGTPGELERIQKEKKAEGFILIELRNIANEKVLGFVSKEGYTMPESPKQPPDSSPELTERLLKAEKELAEARTEAEKVNKRAVALEQADLDNKEMINGLGEMLMTLVEG